MFTNIEYQIINLMSCAYLVGFIAESALPSAHQWKRVRAIANRHGINRQQLNTLDNRAYINATISMDAYINPRLCSST